MKILIILTLLSLKQLSCERSSNLVRNEFDREYHKLIHENVKLHKIIADLKTENGYLKFELYEMRKLHGANHREKRKTSEEYEMNFGNCSALANEAEYLSQNLKTFSDDVKYFNSLVDEQLGNNATKNKKITTDKQSDCECQPTKLFGLKFVDKTMYEKVCNVRKSNGEWTVIQRRIDGTTDFYRPWSEYKQGFGTMTGEFFIGLDSLHLLTTCARQELRIDMEDFDNQKRYAMYNLFQIGDESEKYKMKELGKYTGNAGDALSYHKSYKFSTFDQDNDVSGQNCAQSRRGAWWYSGCHKNNLNGEYGNKEFGKGIIWEKFRGDYYSLRKVEMKIRAKFE